MQHKSLWQRGFGCGRADYDEGCNYADLTDVDPRFGGGYEAGWSHAEVYAQHDADNDAAPDELTQPLPTAS